MADPAEKPDLRLVPLADPQTGEIPADAPQTLGDALRRIGELTMDLEKAEAERDGAERDLRAARVRERNLKRDKLAEAQRGDLWPVAFRVFEHWRRRCRHPKSSFTLDRYELIEPFLRNEDYGETVEEREALCCRAVDGAGFDPFVTKRKNGTPKRHDGIELIFRDSGKFEEFCNRAPRSDPAP